MDKDIFINYPLIPQPAQLVPSEGIFSLAPSTRISVTPEAHGVGEYLQELLHVPLISESTHSDTIPAGGILLTNTGASSLLGAEGYQLSVSPAAVVVRANQPAGLFYGVQTFRQLINLDNGAIPAVEIYDRPRFPWRGIMLDVGRHLFPLEFLKRLIDVFALHKLNVFHWHLTEDQGWRIEIKKYPRLTTIGSKRSSSPIQSDRKKLDGIPYHGFYTQVQIRDIVSYAASRFITVVPEIEMPGHSIAALASYPQLGCTGGPYKVRNYWGIEKDVFCAGNKLTYSFLEDVLDEVLTLFPSEFIHIGGDECPKDRWQQCPKCHNVMKQNNLKDEYELQSYFICRIATYLNAKGRRMIGWDEILEGGLALNAAVMSWRGMEGGIQAARGGHDVVMTPTDHCYFDYYQSKEMDKEPPAIGGFLPLEAVYSFDPVPKECTEDEARHILGAQGNLWTEYIPSPEQAEYMLFPRATALAEVLWSGAEKLTFVDFQQRLQVFLVLLKKMGVNYHMN